MYIIFFILIYTHSHAYIIYEIRERERDGRCCANAERLHLAFWFDHTQVGPAPSSHLRSAKRASHTWPWDNVIYGDLINKNRLRVYAHVGFPVLRWWYLVMFAGGLAVSRSRLTPPDVLNQGARFTVDASKKVRNKNWASSKPLTCR